MLGLNSEARLESEICQESVQEMDEELDSSSKNTQQRQDSSLKKVLSMQKAHSQAGSSDQVSDKPTPFELLPRDEQDRIVLQQAKQEHDLYLTQFFARLAELAEIKNRHVIGIRSTKGGAAFPYPSMEYFRKSKKSQDKIAFQKFSRDLCGKAE